MPVSIEVAEARCRYGTYRFPKNDEFAGKSLMIYGEWAQDELSLILTLLDEDQVVIDGGAFVGTHSIPMARSLGAGGMVHAFEPNKLVYPLLEENLRANAVTNVVTYPFALSHFPGVLYERAALDERSNSDAALVNYAHNQPSRTPDDDEVDPVTAIHIDGLHLDRCDFMKLDLEGMEPNAIIGASATIDKYRPILYVECNTVENGWTVASILRPYGYQLWLHRCEVFSKDNFKGATVDVFDQSVETNLVCVPQERKRDIQKLLTFQESLYPVASLDDLALGFVQSGRVKEAAFGPK